VGYFSLQPFVLPEVGRPMLAALARNGPTHSLPQHMFVKGNVMQKEICKRTTGITFFSLLHLLVAVHNQFVLGERQQSKLAAAYSGIMSDPSHLKEDLDLIRTV
jgi:hypothetical protein